VLAIVIPYYKLTFFKETLDSLANQTVKKFKVYIGDDASPEDCSSLLKEYKGQFKFKHKRFKTNLGGVSLTKQWKRCIDLIEKEEWLMILGDDDYLDNNVVEYWYKYYDEFNKESNVVRFSTKCVEDNVISKPFEHPKWEMATDLFFRKYKKLTRGSLSEYIFRKSSYSKHGFKNYPLAWFSDDRAWLDFSERLPIFTINETCVYVRESSMSITGNSDNKNDKLRAEYLFTYDVYKYYLKYFDKNKTNEFLYRFEEVIKKSRKLSIREWYKLFILYSLNFKFIHWVRFLRRFFISRIKNI
jgi:glycosyltransferase involved in cell wall biosynthesis